MTPKILSGILLAAAVLPLAPAADGAAADDTLSRMFPYVSGARAAVEGSGIGWYDAATPENVCLNKLLGVELGDLGVFYYETGRVYTNLPGFVKPFRTPGQAPIPVACPPALNAACTAASGCAIHIDPVRVGPSATTIAPQDGLICTQQTFVTCIAVGATWWLGLCEWADASFVARVAGAGKGFLAGTGLEDTMFSQDIDCTGYLPFRDYSFLLGNGGDPLSTGARGVPVAAEVPFGGPKDESGFLVSCLTVTYQVVNPPDPVTTVTVDGVDWALVLEIEHPGNWLGPQLAHLGFGGGGQSLAGYYDLGGDNDCDVDADDVQDPPTCFDGLDNDNDGAADDADDECYGNTANGAEYYDARSNSE